MNLHGGLQNLVVDFEQKGAGCDEWQQRGAGNANENAFCGGFDADGRDGVVDRGGHAWCAGFEAEAVGDLAALNVEIEAAEDACDEEEKIFLPLALANEEVAFGQIHWLGDGGEALHQLAVAHAHGFAEKFFDVQSCHLLVAVRGVFFKYSEIAACNYTHIYIAIIQKREWLVIIVR